MGIKILLADDSITIQKVVGIIFGGEDYSLIVVDNGKAAVEKARELNPDVLLIDALMPGMSGYEVCEAVRATASISTKPILLLTGSFEPFDETKAKSCGADDFLSKPFESQQIVSKVKALIELGSSRSILHTAGQNPHIQQHVPEVAKKPAAADDIWGTFTAPEVPTPAAILATMASPVEEHTSSQWVPVEEETFAFEEESAVEQPAQVAPTPVAATPVTLTDEQLRAALTAVSKDVIERIVWEVVPDLAEVLIKEAIRKIKEGQ
jgi:DNA-binding response OmpR family regulator